jgi:hypothetical protein
MYSDEHQEGEKTLQYVFKAFMVGVFAFGLMIVGVYLFTP